MRSFGGRFATAARHPNEGDVAQARPVERGDPGGHPMHEGAESRSHG